MLKTSIRQREELKKTKQTNSVTLSSQYLEVNIFSETWHDANLIRCAVEHLHLFYVKGFFKMIDIDDKVKEMFYLCKLAFTAVDTGGVQFQFSSSAFI